MSRGVVEDTKFGCGGRGSVGHRECSDYTAYGSAGNEESGRLEECLGRVVRRSGAQLLSEAVYVDAKGKEDAGHECTFCCTCWTDE
ncbi:MULTISPECIES: hypothetical protein [unclassified Paenibacillus]|uniref:hypothetical protein n=1 Tax=unclassified Paenibacillus TaxID=185978 RepID=UPI0009CAAB6C|nr:MULTISPECIES: hypothetical protein [unclassified Paenibacillus]SLK03091.1 hypothetical protein SAMN06272722_103365 [Paenibacillus sp. RU5A]SOC69191.1 hypothetical protein SAMN05880581_103365 [Paenibacillus sp. RU26A]SOC71637.1 hypothetical protein SAMN05880586_103365 [Paenibacillus sp. RU5M]